MINNFCKWTLNLINLNWFNNYNKYTYKQQKPFESFSSVPKLVNPIEFYAQLDSGLALAPVLLHLWNKLFKRLVQRGKEDYISVDELKLANWEKFILAGNKILIKLNQLCVNSENVLQQYADALQLRNEEYQMLKNKQISKREIINFEKNLYAFIFDLDEDITYNINFSKVKYNGEALSLLEELRDVVVKVPGSKTIQNLPMDSFEIHKHSPFIHNYNCVQLNTFQINNCKNEIDKYIS